MPYLGNTPSTSFATVVKDSFSGDGSTVAFTLSKVATTNSVSVFVENVRQEPTTAYAVSGTTLTFTAAPVTSSGNNIYVLHMNPTTTTTHPAAQNLTAVDGTFSGKVTMQSDGNTEQLKLVSTDADANEGPLAILYRNSSSPADGDSLGRIYFSGENDAGEEIQYVRFQSILSDASDGTEDSAFRIQSYVGGNLRSRLLIDPTETVFNDDSVDLDFRVESDGDANMLFVEGETNMIGVKTNDPKEVLDVRGVIVASGDHATSSNAQGSAHGVMLSSSSGTGIVSPISNGNNDVDLTLRGLNGGSFENRLVLDSDGDVTVSAGNLVIGTGGKGIDFSAQTAASGQSASATGELFDRYEEGIFTHAGNSNMTINSVSARGFYTIIGDKCFINGFVRFTHSGSDNVTLSLPVASKGDITSPANGEQEASNITWFPSVNTSGDTQLVSMYVPSGSSSVTFYNLGTGSGVVTNNGCDSTAEFYYNLNYKIA